VWIGYFVRTVRSWVGCVVGRRDQVVVCRPYGGFVLVANCLSCDGRVLRVVVRLDEDLFFYDVQLVVQKISGNKLVWSQGWSDNL
jgi:hypothetical protein